MWPTLFYIPNRLFGLPVFGGGVLLGVWALASLLLLVRLVRKQGWNQDTLGYLPVLGLLGAVIYWVLPGLIRQGNLPGLPIRGYGVFVLLGVVSGVALAVRRAQQLGWQEPVETVTSLAFWMFVAGIGGARAFHVVEYWDNFQHGTLGERIVRIANITQGGLVVYGAALGALAAIVVFAWRRRLSVWALADLAAPSMMVGQSLGRIGCLMFGCCYGGLCTLPWAVQFPAGSPPYRQQARAGLLAPQGIEFGADEAGRVIVREVAPDSPAAQAGVRKGLHVSRVQGIAAQSPDLASAVLASVASAGAVLELAPADGGAPLRWSAAPERSAPVHPTQLYSAIDAALLAWLLWEFFPYRRRTGQVFALMLVLHASSRFLLEAIRTDEAAVWGTGLSISQVLSVGLFVIGAVCWFAGPRTSTES